MNNNIKNICLAKNGLCLSKNTCRFGLTTWAALATRTRKLENCKTLNCKYLYIFYNYVKKSKKKKHFTLLWTGMTREVIIAISDNWHDREYRRWVSIWYDPGLSYTPCHIDNIQPQVLFKKWAEIYYQVRFKNLRRSREFSNQIIHDWEFFEQFQKFYRSPHSCTITKYLITDLVWVSEQLVPRDNDWKLL